MTASILVVDTMGGLGDLMLALPVIEALARSHPAARLTVVTTAPWHELLLRDPRIHAVVPVPGRDADAVLGTVGPVLEHLRPDLAVTTNRQHGLPALLERHSARAITDLWRQPPADEPVDLRMLRILAEEGVVDADLTGVLPRVVLDRAEVVAGHAALDAAGLRRPAVLLPDSGMPVKRWPLARWSELVGRLRDAGLDALVVTEADEQRRALVGAGAHPAPDLGLRALAGLSAAAAARGGVAVGGDTGPVRLASAAGLRTVGLFGPTLASRYGYRGEAVDLQGFPDCPVRTPTAITEQECWWTASCPLSADRSPRCMAAIAVDDVLGAATA